MNGHQGGGGYDSNRRGQFGGDGGSSWNQRDDGGGFGGGSRDNKLTIDVANSNIGKLIGKRGAKIQELQNESGARIKIKKEDSDGYNTPVDLIGSDGAIHQAKEMINQLILQAEQGGYRQEGGWGGGGGGRQYGGSGDGGSSWRDERGGGGGGFGGGSRDDKITIQVQNSDIGKLIGKGGSKIRELQDDSRARIKILKEESVGHTTPVDLIGSEDAIYRAKEMIDELFSQSEPAFRNDGGFGRGGGRDDKITIQVQNGDIGKLIGKGGSKIRELQDHSGARIKIQNDNAGHYDTPVDLLGSAESTKLAQELIEELLAPMQE